MTKEEILAMKPSRRLDAEVALRIFGVKEITIVGEHYYIDPIVKQVPSYSTDIASAWEVVEKMREKAICIDIETFADFYQAMPSREDGSCMDESVVSRPNVAEAIVKAALLAVME